MSTTTKARLGAIGLVLAGLVPVFYLLALLVWQYATHVQTRAWVALPASLAFTDHATLQATAVVQVLAFLPQLPSSWMTNEALIWILGRMHIGVGFALIGLVVSAFGLRMILRQNAMLLMEERTNEDRLRRLRLRQYGDHHERIEPFIGPGAIPSSGREEKKAA